MSGNSKDKTKPDIVTFGCRLNVFESEVMRGAVAEADLENAIVFNTCAVTAEATRQARQAIRRAKRENPDATLIVTGCAAQIAPDNFAKMPEVDHVLGNQEKLKSESYARLPVQRNAPEAFVQVDDIMARDSVDASMVEGLEGRTRAFVQVQNGCDHRCTFCIIPYGRGPSASVPQGQVVEQIKRLTGNGFKEIILTGIDINSYGPDLPGSPRLGRLVEQILAHVPELQRLRFGTLDPAAIDDTLFELLASESRVLPHAHWSMQAGSNMVLKRMKRRHDRETALDLCQALKARRPEMTFGADFIAGFPTETEEMHEETLRFVKEAGLAFLHVFPYSAREGTPAAKMPPVDGPTIKRRAAELRGAGTNALNTHLLSRVGGRLQVLAEREDFGHADGFERVDLTTPVEPGAILTVQALELRDETLLGQPVE